MRFIGQYIQSLIARFRNDVYLEDVQSGTVGANDKLGIDSTGKIVKTSGVPIVRTFAITVVNVNGNKYFIDGSNLTNSSITLLKGHGYIFDQSHSSNDNHPLFVSTTSNGTHGSGTAYSTGWTSTGIPGNAGAQSQFIVATDAPNNLYYYCANHPNMGGSITTSVLESGTGAVTSLTTNGTTGAATLSSGVLNVPEYAGGSVSIVDNDITTTYSSTSTITIQGDEVQSFQNGANNVLLNIGTGVSTASDFSISTDSVASYGVYRIGTPYNSTNKNFFAGNFAGQSSKKATKDSEISWSSNLAGNMEGSSKIVVVVEGPIDNTNSGSGNTIATHTHTVTSNGNSTANGITVTVSNYGIDGYDPKRKANINVTISLPTIANAVAAAQGITSTHSGSQKFYSVKISHKNNDLSTQHGSTFSSAEFFYDGAQVRPVGTNANINLTSSSTKYLSNIKYYSAAQWRVDGSNIQNIARDTRGNGSDVIIRFSDSGAVDDIDGLRYEALDGNSNNSVNDNTNDYTTNWDLADSNYYLNFRAGGRLAMVYGGLAAHGFETSYDYDSYRIINTYNGSSIALTENFREEEYRLPEHTESTWNTNTVSQSVSTWNGYSVSGAMSSSSVTINNAHNSTKDLLLQVQSSGGTFKLIHPYNFDQLNVAANPAQDKYSGAAISQSTSVKYYRWFRFSSSVDEFNCDITGMTRASYISSENSGYINIKFSRPGVDNTWVPLNPDQGFQSGTPNDSCWHASNGYSSSTPGYNSDTNVFKCTFGTASILFVIEITMTGHFNKNITQIGLST